MPNLSDDAAANLPAKERALYAVEKFIEAHPEYLACDHNKKLMLDYIQDNGKELNLANLESAYETNKPRLRPQNEAIAKMTAREVKTLAKEIGEPRYDEFGRITGYDWPDDGTSTAFRTARADPRDRVGLTLRPSDVMEKRFDHKPTAKELALMGPDDYRHALAQFPSLARG